MTYKEFIRGLKKFATEKVIALSFPESCAVNQIPRSFSFIFPDLINLIHHHINEFCNSEEVLALFSLQVAPGRIESALPKRLNRVCYPHCPNDHFCCALSYLILPSNNKSPVRYKGNYRSLFIDFTTGEMMDSDHYLFLTGYQTLPGKIYGQLNSNLLEKAWQLSGINRNEHHEKIRAYS